MTQELKAIRGGDIHDLVEFGDGIEIYHSETLYYLKNVADEALDEKDAEIAKLKQKLESVQASMYADVVDTNMENRRLKRALWLARTWRAKERQRMLPNNKEFYAWQNVERKCRAKAEEYK